MVDNVSIYGICGFILLAFSLGSMFTTFAAWLGAVFTRKAHTTEPMFEKPLIVEPEEEEEVIEETQEEKEEREARELAEMRGDFL